RYRRRGGRERAPLPDFYIGAHAASGARDDAAHPRGPLPHLLSHAACHRAWVTSALALRPRRRALVDEGRKTLAHLVGGERRGEHREVDRGELALQVAFERRARLRARLSHPLDS